MITVLILVLILAIIAVVIAFIVGAACGVRGQADVLAKKIDEADISDQLKIELLKSLLDRFKSK